MDAVQQFDVLIIGGGEAGKNLAWTMAQMGRRAAVPNANLSVDRARISAVCRVRTFIAPKSRTTQRRTRSVLHIYGSRAGRRRLA